MERVKVFLGKPHCKKKHFFCSIIVQLLYMIDIKIWCSSGLTRWFMNLNSLFFLQSFIHFPGGNLDFLKQFGSRQEKMEITYEALLGVVGASLMSWVIHRFWKMAVFLARPPRWAHVLTVISQVKNMVSIVQNKIRMLVFLIGFGKHVGPGLLAWVISQLQRSQVFRRCGTWSRKLG